MQGMKRMTTGLCLAALLLSAGMNSVLGVDETGRPDNFFVANESRHQWVNEHNGRTGMLIVSGALLSSPCTLETSEAALPLPRRTQGIRDSYELALTLVGCGDGGAVTSAASGAGRDSTMVVYSALLTGIEGGLLQPEQRMVGTGRAVLHGGANRLTWSLSQAQQQALITGQASDRAQGKPYMNPRDNHALLRLRLDYE